MFTTTKYFNVTGYTFRYVPSP